MTEELLINYSDRETRVAVLEHGLVQEILIERTHAPSIVGNIYKGKVSRILPGMQSAFVDIGLERAAFVHVSDIADRELVSADAHDLPPIQSLVHEGQTIIGQVTKEAIGTKGARLSTNVSLSSRYLVYMPGTDHIGISHKIDDPDERGRLQSIMADWRGQAGCPSDGFIIRTAAEFAGQPEIVGDAVSLVASWQGIESRCRTLAEPALVYEDLPLHLRIMRDLIDCRTARIIVDSPEVFEKLDNFIEARLHGTRPRLERATDEVALFDRYNVEDQIQQALSREVALKSGGYLVIDQTEAMTTIDVNTGAFVGRKDLEETIYRTNLEAAAAIPRQLRLRNIGGIVILDFIDMVDEEHKRQVLRVLEKGQLVDRARYRISGISELGLVEMTRKRTHESLASQLCETCSTCGGKGVIKSAETVCLEIFREVVRRAAAIRDHECLIMASQTVVDRLLDEDAESLQALATSLPAEFRFQVEASYSQEQFDVVPALNQ